MDFPANTIGPNCVSPCVANAQVSAANCSLACQTRMNQLKTGMQTFLTASGAVAWMGLATYPTSSVMPPATSPDSCGPTGNADVLAQLAANPADSVTDLTLAADSVNTHVQALVAGGGTPTAASLRFVGGYAPLHSVERSNFVVLLTDGLPNCNAANPNACDNANQALCRCTLATCSIANGFCARGCLDADSSAAAASELRQAGIRTIVVGFGTELSTSLDGIGTLNAIAQAGGVPRGCPSGLDAECGAGNTCNPATKICAYPFYQATSAGDLAQVLSKIASGLGQ
jgi:hypothetical protein